MAWTIDDLAGLLADAGCPVWESDDASVQFGMNGDEPGRTRAARVDVASSDSGRMLTFTSTYEFTAPRPDDARLAGALLAPWFVLGHTLVDGGGGVHHRYSLVVERERLTAEVVGQVVAILDYEQVHFGDYLESVCVRGTPPELLADLVTAGEAGGLD